MALGGSVNNKQQNKLNKGQSQEEEEKQNEIKDTQLYSLTGQNYNKYSSGIGQFGQITEIEENLPGMSTTTFDFLKNPSTKTRL